MINYLHGLHVFIPVQLKCSAQFSVLGMLPPGSLSCTSLFSRILRSLSGLSSSRRGCFLGVDFVAALRLGCTQMRAFGGQLGDSNLSI